MVRCAIYTRKSSDEGLEQSFNSLDAQRDACEAYIASQKHEGWRALQDSYDNGGFSGGSMERPALKRLLDDIAHGLIDVVVVYKVDRLTRALADFAKLTDLFDRHGTSFVSVTQQFNTSTSMGRLTLNVLLSFAQFERELAGERIRDKIALSKRRGMWMGGLPPLGYDGIDKALVVNEREAETVNLIYRRYLELGSVPALKRWLDGQGIVSKRRTFADGRTAGGVSMSRGAIYQVLSNRLYRGEIAHRGDIHAGNHPAIMEQELWDAVQARLAKGARRRMASAPSSSSRRAGAEEGSSLAGRAFDAEGNRLSPTYTQRRGRRYRYYVSAALVRGGASRTGIRVPAGDLEKLVMDGIAGHLCDPTWVVGLATSQAVSESRKLIEAAASIAANPASCHALIQRVVVTHGSIAVTLDGPALATALGAEEVPIPADQAIAAPISFGIPARTLRLGKQVRFVIGQVHAEERRLDPDLIRLVADAHRWFDELKSGRTATIADIAKRDRQQVSKVSRALPLAFLAPDIVTLIIEGRQPPTLTVERLARRRHPLPMDWAEQRAMLT
jgi:DNA invertase Pin-like site-specific DNA recombinase